MSGDLASDFSRFGAARFAEVLNEQQAKRIAQLFDVARPGRRLSRSDLRSIADLISATGPIGTIAAQLLDRDAIPVRALLLDKSAATNWRLGWHQDRTISVRERIDVPGFGPWSVKSGQLHVQPPYELTAGMVTLRAHIDDVGDNNAPLRILPGTHLIGRLDTDAIKKLASRSEKLVCLADSGDVWAYSTAIVHASAEQKQPGRRRVLQLDYSSEDLPGGLQWVPLI